MKNILITVIKIITPTLAIVIIYAFSTQRYLPQGKAFAELNYHLTPPYTQDTCNKINISMGETIVGDHQCVEGTPAHVGAYGLTINVDSADGQPHTFNYIVYRNNCPQGFAKPCTQNLISNVSNNNTTPKVINIALQTPKTGYFCGTYQDDIAITSVDGNSNCHYGDPNSTQFGSSEPGSAGLCATYVNCPGGTPLNPAYGISGNLYIDANKNGTFDAGEQLYSRGTNIFSITGPTNFTTTTATGGYLTQSNLPAGTYTVSYTNLATGYYMSYPRTGPPPSFSVSIGPGCNTNGAVGASCDGSGNISNLNFGITNLASWIQASCADIRIDNGITNPIPQTALCGSSSCPYMLVTNNNCTNPGVVFTGDTTADFGSGQASTNTANWTVGGATNPEVFSTTGNLPINIAYANLLSQAQKGNINITNLNTVSGCSNLSNCTLPANLPHGIYQSNGSVKLNAYTTPANSNYIFLIKGDLTIQGNINIPNGSTALFATSGNISVASSVGSAATATQSNLDGFYVSGQSFIINSTGSCSDLRLNTAGSIVTNANRTGGSFQNLRDLCNNDTNYPTVTFSIRPDLVLNAPQFLTNQTVNSQEQAP
jgi:hypothetical protein